MKSYSPTHPNEFESSNKNLAVTGSTGVGSYVHVPRYSFSDHTPIDSHKDRLGRYLVKICTSLYQTKDILVELSSHLPNHLVLPRFG
jgi:hypothetical protein